MKASPAAPPAAMSCVMAKLAVTTRIEARVGTAGPSSKATAWRNAPAYPANTSTWPNAQATSHGHRAASRVSVSSAKPASRPIEMMSSAPTSTAATAPSTSRRLSIVGPGAVSWGVTG